MNEITAAIEENFEEDHMGPFLGRGVVRAEVDSVAVRVPLQRCPRTISCTIIF